MNDLDELEQQARVAGKIEDHLLAIAELWPVLKQGEVNLNVMFSKGRVRRTYVHWGPIAPGQLGRAGIVATRA